jgi:hypothetical protein
MEFSFFSYYYYYLTELQMGVYPVAGYYNKTKQKQKKTVASVHEQTIPTGRPPLSNEVSTNFCG